MTSIEASRSFHPISQEDIPLLLDTLGSYAGFNSDCAPANCLAWGGLHNTFVRFDRGIASVRYEFDGMEKLFLYPVGRGDAEEAAAALVAEERQAGSGEIRFMCSSEQVERLPEGFEKELRRDLTDYVFDAPAFAECKGHRYQRLRNFLSVSQRRYDARFAPLEPDSREPALQLARETMLTKSEAEQSELEYELRVIDILLDNADALRVSGMLAFDGGAPIAALIASRPRDDLLDIHILKQNPSYVGIAQSILHKFVSQSVQAQGVRWFNIEEDLGLPNLRKAKLEMHPDILDDKYLCTLRL